MERIVDIATDGRHLSVYRGFLVVAEDREEVGRLALDDIAALIVHAHGVTWSTNLVVALAERGVPMLLCGANHSPAAVCLPVDGHHAQNRRIRDQWEAKKPLTKQLWRRIVIAKIRSQAALLGSVGKPTQAFELLERRVASGDPQNVEAQAARRYWPLLMGKDFRRDRTAAGTNAMLNYGYAILRSLCARAVIASGLHPSIGIHHAHRGNALALADDLIEPFRVLADAMTIRLIERGVDAVTPEAKRAFASLIDLDVTSAAGETTTLSVAALRAAQTLATSFQSGKATDFVLPEVPTASQLQGMDALLQ